MKVTKYLLSDGITITLEYRVARRLTYYRKDKHFPKVTQCLIFKDTLLCGFGEVVKHTLDEYDQLLAYMLSAEKAIEAADLSYLSKELLEMVKTQHIRTNGKFTDENYNV